MNGAGNSRNNPTPLEVVGAVIEAHREFLRGDNTTDILSGLFDKTGLDGQNSSAQLINVLLDIANDSDFRSLLSWAELNAIYKAVGVLQQLELLRIIHRYGGGITRDFADQLTNLFNVAAYSDAEDPKGGGGA